MKNLLNLTIYINLFCIYLNCFWKSIIRKIKNHFVFIFILSKKRCVLKFSFFKLLSISYNFNSFSDNNIPLSEKFSFSKL